MADEITEITDFTDEQIRMIADWSSQLANGFVGSVRSQVEAGLQSAVIRTVCGVVLGTQVASGDDPDAIRRALGIAINTVAEAFEKAGPDAAPQAPAASA